MTLDQVIFVISAAAAIFGATMMIAQRNPIASVLYLILSLLAQAVIYIQLGALFLGAILVVVYAGAILVLFLFVIMLLNLRGGEDLGRPTPVLSRLAKYVLALLFLVEMISITYQGFQADVGAGVMALAPDGFGSVTMVATRLFREYLYPFELTGVLLLVAVVGAVVIAKRDTHKESPGGAQGKVRTDESPTESVKG